LITEVLYRKQTPLKKFIVVDAAMNNLIRPSLYNAHHEIVPVRLNKNELEKVDVVGPVCESSDFFAKDRNLPYVEQGDYLAITASGAYGQALASNYNLRTSVKEYLVDKDNVNLIYNGRSIENIFKEYDF
jgi:diaminopimelate decarboxylase